MPAKDANETLQLGAQFAHVFQAERGHPFALDALDNCSADLCCLLDALGQAHDFASSIQWIGQAFGIAPLFHGLHDVIE